MLPWGFLEPLLFWWFTSPWTWSTLGAQKPRHSFPNTDMVNTFTWMFVVDHSLLDTGLMKYLKMSFVVLDPIPQGGGGEEFSECLWSVFLSMSFLEELNFRNWIHVQVCSEWYNLHLVTVFSLCDMTVNSYRIETHIHTHTFIFTLTHSIILLLFN